MKRVVDLAALDDAFAAPAGAVFAGVRQHDALPQGGGQDGLSFTDGK